jgi:hypothetical protein
VSDLDLAFAPTPPDDGLTVTGPVYAVDAAARLVHVGLPGGSALWLPAQPGRYRRSSGTGIGLARVLLNPGTGRPSLVLGPLDPQDPVVPATLTAATSTVATVTWAGGSYALPYLAGAYGAPPVSVWVSLSDWGVPVLVLGPSAVAPAPPPAGGGGPPTGGGTVQVTQSIGPQWSGAWRASSGRWGDWNTGRFGGRADLYQGNGFGSGPMTGLATYGDQITNLGATSIGGIKVRALRNGFGSTSGASLVLQGSPHGAQPGGAASGAGPTVALSPVGPDGWAEGWLPAALCEGLRTGAYRGLVAVGGTASGWGGTATPGSMVLETTYTRPA